MEINEFSFFFEKKRGGSKKNFVNGIHFLFSYPFRYSEGGLDGYDNTWFLKKLQLDNCGKKCFTPEISRVLMARDSDERERKRLLKKYILKEGGGA